MPEASKAEPEAKSKCSDLMSDLIRACARLWRSFSESVRRESSVDIVGVFLLRQFFEQRLGGLEIRRGQTLTKPTVHFSKHRAFGRTAQSWQGGALDSRSRATRIFSPPGRELPRSPFEFVALPGFARHEGFHLRASSSMAS